MSIEQIIVDMFKFTKDFPIKVIPHITEGQEVNDIIHNYKKNRTTQPAGMNVQSGSLNQLRQSHYSLLQNA